jgi:hypothetical protein
MSYKATLCNKTTNYYTCYTKIGDKLLWARISKIVETFAKSLM